MMYLALNLMSHIGISEFWLCCVELNRNSAGFVYLRFEAIQASMNARQALHGRWFAGKMITATYMVLDLLHIQWYYWISLVENGLKNNFVRRFRRCTRLNFLTAEHRHSRNLRAEIWALYWRCSIDIKWSTIYMLYGWTKNE